MWELESGDTLRTLQGRPFSVQSIASTAGGRWLVASILFDRLYVWDLENGEQVRTLYGHTSELIAVGLAPDGCRVVSGSWDNTVRVWDLKAGRELVRFTVDVPVTACSVAQDSRTIAVGDCFGRVHFLRLIEPDPTEPAIGETKIQLLQHKQPGNDCS